MNTLNKAALASGVAATLVVILILGFAYASVPLVGDILRTGVPVVYYGQAMLLLVSAAIGLGVSLIVLYLGRGPRYHKSQQKDYNRRLLSYGGVGFLTVGVPTMLMDPGAMSVGIGVVILWKTLASQQEAAREKEAIEEKEPILTASARTREEI